MTSLYHIPGPSALWHLIEGTLIGLIDRLRRPMHGRRVATHRPDHPSPHRHQQHFGSLDDQLLNDLGLLRSDMRAAEYGILPGDQALHHEGDHDGADKGGDGNP